MNSGTFGSICQDFAKDHDQIPQTNPHHLPTTPEGHTTDAIRTFALWILAHYTERTDDREHVASHGGLKVGGRWLMHVAGKILRALALTEKSTRTRGLRLDSGYSINFRLERRFLC